MDKLGSGSGSGLPPRGEKRLRKNVSSSEGSKGSKSPEGSNDGLPERKKARFEDSDSEGEGKTILEQYRFKMKQDQERQNVKEDRGTQSDEDEIDYSDSSVHSEGKNFDEGAKKLKSAITDDMQKIIELSKKLRFATKRDISSEHSEFEEHLRGMRDDLRALKSTREALKGNITRLEEHQNDSDTRDVFERIKSKIGELTEKEKFHEVKIREMIIKSIDDNKKALDGIVSNLYYNTTKNMNSREAGFKELVQATEANLERYSTVKKETLDAIDAFKRDDDIDEDTKNALDNKKDDINGDSGKQGYYNRRLGQMQQALKRPLMGNIRIEMERLSKLDRALERDTASRMSSRQPGYRELVQGVKTNLDSFMESNRRVVEDIAYIKKLGNLDSGMPEELNSFERKLRDFSDQEITYASGWDRMDSRLLQDRRQSGS